MNKAVYIPTHNRTELSKEAYINARAVFPEDIPIFLVMDRGQENQFDGFNVLIIEEIGMRLSYAMKVIIDHAQANGYEYIIKSDDDIRFPENAMELFQDVEEHQEIAWSGIYIGFYGIMKLKKNTGTFYNYSMGCRTYSMNVHHIIDSGNFDPIMIVNEDDDMKVNLMKHGYYCAVNTDVQGKSLEKCEGEGGIATFGSRREDEKLMVELLSLKHGDFFTLRGKNPRSSTSWMKAQKAGLFPKIDFSLMGSRGGKRI